MTADQVKGRGFRGALLYNLEKMGKGIAQVLDTNFAQVSEKGIMQEVRMIRALKPNLQKYFYHTSLNFPPRENLPNEKMLQIAKDYLEQNGFSQHQYIIFRHYDADHPHLHILVNRIGFDGKVLSDSQDYARSEKILRRLEQKYNLTKVQSSRQAQERAMTKNELEMMKRTDEVSVKMKLQVIVKSILQQNPSTDQFIQALEGRGINLLFNQASTGFVSGISYGYEGMIFKGTSLGNTYKWSSVKNIINYEQERDRSTIHEANLRTKSHGATCGLGEDINYAERDTSLAPGQRISIQGNTSEADRPNRMAIQRPAGQGKGYKLSIGKSGTVRKGDTQPDRSQSQGADQAAVLAGHLIRGLFSPTYSNSGDDMAALNQFKKKKKERSKGLGR